MTTGYVLYEASPTYGVSIPFIILCLIDIVLIFMLLMVWWKNSTIGTRLSTLFVILVLTFIISTIMYTYFDAKIKVYDEYISGNYLIVEGYVDNYTQDPDGAALPDTFNVENIDFIIPGFTTIWGYPMRKIDGGILEEGDYVRISYVNYKFENVIMKLEIFEKNIK